MSSTNRGAERRPDDFYSTPAWAVHRLLEACPLPAGRWLEPCAGTGAIMHAVDAVRLDVEWSAVELREEERPKLLATTPRVRIGDYLAESPGLRFDVLLTNPPFSLMVEFLERALCDAAYVVMLGRLAFLETAQRAPLFHAAQPDVYVLPDRPSFTNGPTDSCAYAWFVWPPDRLRSTGTVRVLAPTPLHVRRPRPPKRDGGIRGARVRDDNGSCFIIPARIAPEHA